MIARFAVLAFWAWAYLPLAMAQPIQGIHKTITTADGLPSSTVTGLVQDHTGFIWIATSDAFG